MRKRIFKTLAATALITCLTGSTVFADEVTDLKNTQSAKQSELDSFQDQLAYLLVQMDELEQSMADLTAKIEQANIDLAAAEVVQQGQYDDMKLRIKYLYEDQSTTLSEVLLTSSSMSDMLNKTEYVQQVYDYDRDKLTEMANTATEIKNIKAGLESDQNELLAQQDEYLESQTLLVTSIDEAQSEIDDLSSQITSAVNKAAQLAASKTTTTYASSFSGTANNNSATASSVVSMAYSLLGIPYVYGGSSTSGFDCSGFTSYVFANAAGIGLSRTSGGQTYSGQSVGSLSEAQPGDIICYPGHVGIYIGNGQMIHAPSPGDVVKVSSVNIGMSIVGIRRYW